MFFKKKSDSIDPLIVEKHEYMFYTRHLKRNDTVFDIGANIGELTLLFSRFVGDNGKVYSFEPTPSTFERLSSIISIGNRANVIANNFAMSDVEGTLDFNMYHDHFAAFNTAATRPLAKYGVNIDEPINIKIPCTTIDSYCSKNGIEKIDLLKIDVEGAELQVLKGASKMFSEKRIAVCAFEFGQTIFDMGNTVDEFIDFFKSNGYTVRNVTAKQNIFPIDAITGWGCFSVLYAKPKL